MRNLSLRAAICSVLILASGWSSATAAEPFEFRDGDRVALLGSTLIEREQSSGYWETLLTTRFPDRNILFRNLGWSGDTVFADARAGFGTAVDGFRELQEHVTALQPTVILVCYGANESFAGPAGLPVFEAGLNKLLDMLATTNARLALMTPTPHEDAGRPLPDPAAHNRDLATYVDLLKRVAIERKLPLVDLHGAMSSSLRPAGRLTDNGLHFTPRGYWATTGALAHSLGWTDAAAVPLEISAGGSARGGDAGAEDVAVTGAKFMARSAHLPACPIPPSEVTQPSTAAVAQVARVKGLAAGRYVLKIDGHVVAAGNDREWAVGVPIHSGPDVDQAEKLRAAIVAKNILYFYRWRPQNVTYLFGFRKHEQGQNAKEVAEFDPLIAAAEVEIAQLRVPVPRHYEVVKESESAP